MGKITADIGHLFLCIFKNLNYIIVLTLPLIQVIKYVIGNWLLWKELNQF